MLDPNVKLRKVKDLGEIDIILGVKVKNLVGVMIYPKFIFSYKIPSIMHTRLEINNNILSNDFIKLVGECWKYLFNRVNFGQL